MWNDFELFLQAELRGNKIISLLLHAHIPAENESKWVKHSGVTRTVESSEQEAMM